MKKGTEVLRVKNNDLYNFYCIPDCSKAVLFNMIKFGIKLLKRVSNNVYDDVNGIIDDIVIGEI